MIDIYLMGTKSTDVLDGVCAAGQFKCIEDELVSYKDIILFTEVANTSWYREGRDYNANVVFCADYIMSEKGIPTEYDYGIGGVSCHHCPIPHEEFGSGIGCNKNWVIEGMGKDGASFRLHMSDVNKDIVKELREAKHLYRQYPAIEITSFLYKRGQREYYRLKSKLLHRG